MKELNYRIYITQNFNDKRYSFIFLTDNHTIFFDLDDNPKYNKVYLNVFEEKDLMVQKTITVNDRKFTFVYDGIFVMQKHHKGKAFLHVREKLKEKLKEMYPEFVI